MCLLALLCKREATVRRSATRTARLRRALAPLRTVDSPADYPILVKLRGTTDRWQSCRLGECRLLRQHAGEGDRAQSPCSNRRTQRQLCHAAGFLTTPFSVELSFSTIATTVLFAAPHRHVPHSMNMSKRCCRKGKESTMSGGEMC